jgi:hypothetical protein
MTISDEAAHFDIVSLLDCGTLYKVYKSRTKTNGPIICLKTTKEDMSLVFEAQGIDECFGKLCPLNDSRTEKIISLARSTSTGVVQFLHDYYPFTLESLLASEYSFPPQDLRVILYAMTESVMWLSSFEYAHLDLNLSSSFVTAASHIKLGNLTRAVRSSDFKFLGDSLRNLEGWSPEFLLGDRAKWKELMVWSLGVVIYQVITREKLFTAPIHFPFTRLSAIQAILGRPSESVVEHWRTLPKRDYLPPRIEHEPSILEDKMNRDFPPGMEDLKTMIQNVLEYDPAQIAVDPHSVSPARLP